MIELFLISHVKFENNVRRRTRNCKFSCIQQLLITLKIYNSEEIVNISRYNNIARISLYIFSVFLMT